MNIYGRSMKKNSVGLKSYPFKFNEYMFWNHFRFLTDCPTRCSHRCEDFVTEMIVKWYKKSQNVLKMVIKSPLRHHRSEAIMVWCCSFQLLMLCLSLRGHLVHVCVL